MLEKHVSTTDFVEKKSALKGVVKTLTRNYNLPFEPETLMKEEYLNDIAG